MDQQTVVWLIVNLLVVFLGLVYRYKVPADPAKSWFEMALSIVGAIFAAIVLGKFPPFSGTSDPLEFLRWLGQAWATIFLFVEVIYNGIKSFYPKAAAKIFKV